MGDCGVPLLPTSSLGIVSTIWRERDLQTATQVTTATDSEDGLLNHRRGRVRPAELSPMAAPARWATDLPAANRSVWKDLRSKWPRNPGGGGMWRLREPSGSCRGRGRCCYHLELRVGVASWLSPGVRRLQAALPGLPTCRAAQPRDSRTLCNVFARRASRH